MEDIYTNNYDVEHKQREIIRQKVRNKLKLTTDEIMWLDTHSLYNSQYKGSAYNVVVEHMEPNIWYSIKITVESIQPNVRIIPIISVPGGKGEIITENSRMYIQSAHHKDVKHPILMLGFETYVSCREYEVKYISGYGAMSVFYECDYYDAKQNLHIRQSSSTGATNFAMIRQVINGNKTRYYCKSPDLESFDAMVFTVEWTKINK